MTWLMASLRTLRNEYSLRARSSHRPWPHDPQVAAVAGVNAGRFGRAGRPQLQIRRRGRARPGESDGRLHRGDRNSAKRHCRDAFLPKTQRWSRPRRVRARISVFRDAHDSLGQELQRNWWLAETQTPKQELTLPPAECHIVKQMPS